MEDRTAPEERNMDRRLIERNLRKGIITQQDITAFENELKDVSNNMETFTVDDDEGSQASTNNGAPSRPQTNDVANPPASVLNFSNSQTGA